MVDVFIHSVRVPRIYKEASKLLQDVTENGLGFKERLFKCKHTNIKAINAIVAETIKHFSQINLIIEKVNLLEKEPRLDLWMARILISELLWRNRELGGECKPVKTILSYRDELAKHKETLNFPESDTRVKNIRKPRFARVNTLKLSVEDAIQGFCDEGWNFLDYPSADHEEFLSQVASLNYDQFMGDIHIKELLIFPNKTEFYTHISYQEKAVVLQDKASCLPVHLLNPAPNSVVLDMCAAPGMKTSYLAALLKNEGVIYAIEKNKSRFDLLNSHLEGMDATCVKTINNDALKVTAKDCPNVEYILVDPSCSGSGMTGRILFDNNEIISKDRLKSLAGFQIIILKHALTHFPQAKRVVYSTCSIYREENEEVVEDVLKSTKNFKLVSARRLLNKEDDVKVEDESINEKCINFNYKNDLTNGFFIAVFERIENQPCEPCEADPKLNKRRQREIKRELRAKAKLEDNLEECKPEENERKRTEEEEPDQLSELQEESKPKKKKNKKAKVDFDEEDHGESSKIEDETSNQEKSKKKKQKKEKESRAKVEVEDNLEECKAEQKKRKRTEEEEPEQLSELQEESKPKKKKNKKGKADFDEEDHGECSKIEDEEKSKKKKQKKQSKELQAKVEVEDNLEECKPEKKKRKRTEEEEPEQLSELPEESKPKKKKNKKEKADFDEEDHVKSSKIEDETNNEEKSKKKKQKKEKVSEAVPSEEQTVTESPCKKKKKKKHSN